jgi:acyl-CoA reductase-like NAD-dependent aldehyde dehydrogenase
MTTTCENFIGGAPVPPEKGVYLDVRSPSEGTVVGRVAVSTAADVAAAVERAKEVRQPWHGWSVQA